MEEGNLMERQAISEEEEWVRRLEEPSSHMLHQLAVPTTVLDQEFQRTLAINRGTRNRGQREHRLRSAEDLRPLEVVGQ